MPGRGLEPLRIAPPDPKSGASANFATLALQFWILDFRLPISKLPRLPGYLFCIAANFAAFVTAGRSSDVTGPPEGERECSSNAKTKTAGIASRRFAKLCYSLFVGWNRFKCGANPGHCQQGQCGRLWDRNWNRDLTNVVDLGARTIVAGGRCREVTGVNRRHLREGR